MGPCECLEVHHGWDNFKHKYRLGVEWIESSTEEEDWDMFVDEKLDMTTKYVLPNQKANHNLSCIKSSTTSGLREAILHLCSDETPKWSSAVSICAGPNIRMWMCWSESRGEP